MFVTIFDKISATNTYKRFARHWLASFTFRMFGWPKFRMGHYFKIKQAAHAMDGISGLMAFVSADKQILNWKLNHLLTDCSWGHAGIVYWGEDGELRTKEMLGDGLTDQYLIDLLKEVDDFALMFIPMTPANLAAAWTRLERIEHAPAKVEYDFTLNLDPVLIEWVKGGSEQLNTGKKTPKFKFRAYCSGLVYLAANGLATTGFSEMHEVMEKLVFEPDDVYEQADVLFEEHN